VAENKIAVLTDTNSGISEQMQDVLGVFVLPMPVIIDGRDYFEDISITQKEFYRRLRHGANVSTSQPAPGQLIEKWDELLKTYHEVVYIPMSGGLSSSVTTARALASGYNGRIHVVDNRRVSVTLRQSALEAKKLADAGERGTYCALSRMGRAECSAAQTTSAMGLAARV